MDSKQKQRVVGIIFLVILAVVAIPAFLKHSKENVGSPNVEESEQITQEKSEVLPNEPLPLPDANQPPVIDQESLSNAALNLAPSAIPAPTADANLTQQQSLESMPAEAQPTQPSANTSNQVTLPVAPSPAIRIPESTSPTSPAPPIITTLPAVAPIAAPPETVKLEPVKKPIVLKKAKKEEHHLGKSDWTIRLAILSVRANAHKLVNDLKKQGYHASIEEINTYKGMMYKVTLQKKSSRADADKLAMKLNDSFHIHVMVSRTR